MSDPICLQTATASRSSHHHVSIAIIDVEIRYAAYAAGVISQFLPNPSPGATERFLFFKEETLPKGSINVGDLIDKMAIDGQDIQDTVDPTEDHQ